SFFNFSVGIGASVNTVSDTTLAFIDGSTVKADDDLTLTATSKPNIKALTLGGAASSSAGGGAGSGNTVTNRVESYIVGSHGTGTSPGVEATGAMTLTATDEALITADAGGFALALDLADEGFETATISVGISASINSIADTTRAFIADSAVKAG